MKDQQTHDYFDDFTPHYPPERFNFAIEFLRENAEPDASLIDIGCGDGANLHLIKTQTDLTRFTGMDISEKYLEKARNQVGCETVNGSILDDMFVEQHRGKFDYCTIGSVLHHLIGGTRAESTRLAIKCMENSMALLKPGGHMIIYEPTHGPQFLMTIVFWLKKIIGGIVRKRVEVGPNWINFGQPVVSYYTVQQMEQFLNGLKNAKTVRNVVINKQKLGGVIDRISLGLVVEKLPAKG
jgi:2-polyprenyl-3-methyl-5-hydroxy-6-metoxy-1,4-benzoquinol methylase